ncbi:hypothetical protein MNEG_13197, partial [Monoraphidium neglectum]
IAALPRNAAWPQARGAGRTGVQSAQAHTLRSVKALGKPRELAPWLSCVGRWRRRGGRGHIRRRQQRRRRGRLSAGDGAARSGGAEDGGGSGGGGGGPGGCGSICPGQLGRGAVRGGRSTRAGEAATAAPRTRAAWRRWPRGSQGSGTFGWRRRRRRTRRAVCDAGLGVAPNAWHLGLARADVGGRGAAADSDGAAAAAVAAPTPPRPARPLRT